MQVLKIITALLNSFCIPDVNSYPCKRNSSAQASSKGLVWQEFDGRLSCSVQPHLINNSINIPMVYFPWLIKKNRICEFKKKEFLSYIFYKELPTGHFSIDLPINILYKSLNSKFQKVQNVLFISDTVNWKITSLLLIKKFGTQVCVKYLMLFPLTYKYESTLHTGTNRVTESLLCSLHSKRH